jgi:uncharacterized protein (TIGR03083 family)
MPSGELTSTQPPHRPAPARPRQPGDAASGTAAPGRSHQPAGTTTPATGMQATVNDCSAMAVTWATVAAQRGGLAGELDRLGPDQWNQPSLCEGWQVRHVVAHMIGEATTTRSRAVAGVVRHGFRLDAFIRADALRHGDQPPARLAAAYRSTINLRTGPPGNTPANALVDVVCHTSDIFRPLGRNTPLDHQPLGLAARRLASVGYPIGAKRRIRGLRLVATDIDFDLGAGLLVEGPIEALLLAMAGRPAALGELHGPGHSSLAARI